MKFPEKWNREDQQQDVVECVEGSLDEVQQELIYAPSRGREVPVSVNGDAHEDAHRDALQSVDDEIDQNNQYESRSALGHEDPSILEEDREFDGHLGDVVRDDGGV